MSAVAPWVVRRLPGLTPYADSWAAMRHFSASRNPSTPDECWLLEHPPVYTQGLAGRPEHVLAAGVIPVVQTDRGGQITYHGPGQLVAYLLLDLNRLGLGPRELVRRVESAVIATLADYAIEGERRSGAPGVYVAGAKIAALGLRIRNARTYHGLALNVAPDLAPFAGINPCGYEGLAVTSLARLGVTATLEEVGQRLNAALAAGFYAAGAAPIIESSLPLPPG